MSRNQLRTSPHSALGGQDARMPAASGPKEHKVAVHWRRHQAHQERHLRAGKRSMQGPLLCIGMCLLELSLTLSGKATSFHCFWPRTTRWLVYSSWALANLPTSIRSSSTRRQALAAAWQPATLSAGVRRASLDSSVVNVKVFVAIQKVALQCLLASLATLPWITTMSTGDFYVCMHAGCSGKICTGQSDGVVEYSYVWLPEFPKPSIGRYAAS